MAKLPTIDEFTKQVAEKALNDYVYEGKTILEWVTLIMNSKQESLRPKGRWEKHEARLFRKEYYTCSNCGSRNGLAISFNYCFNCGARMEG